MRRIEPLFFVSLSVLPSVMPLIVGWSAAVSNNHRYSLGQLEGFTSGRSNTRARSYHSLQRSLSVNAAMMVKPSQPVPVNVKDTVSSLQAAVQHSAACFDVVPFGQEGLKARQSRMDVDLPIAARLGVETTEDDKNKKAPTAADVERSDRELARLFLEMFDVIGEQVVVAFPTDEEAQKAEKVWAKGAPFKGRVTSMNPRPQKAPPLKRGSDAFVGFAKTLEAKKKKKNAAGGGGGGIAGKPSIARIAPPGTEVLLVVTPKQPELMTVQKLSKDLGQGCLIILLNARLHQAKFFDDEQRQFYEEEFQSMFHLRPVGIGTEDFLFRSYPKDWTVARKPKIGPPKVLRAQEKRPTQAEITAAIEEGEKAAGVFGNLF